VFTCESNIYKTWECVKESVHRCMNDNTIRFIVLVAGFTEFELTGQPPAVGSRRPCDESLYLE